MPTEEFVDALSLACHRFVQDVDDPSIGHDGDDLLSLVVQCLSSEGEDVAVVDAEDPRTFGSDLVVVADLVEDLMSGLRRLSIAGQHRIWSGESLTSDFVGDVGGHGCCRGHVIVVVERLGQQFNEVPSVHLCDSTYQVCWVTQS